jgi:FMN-dependent NADH-azoreductase
MVIKMFEFLKKIIKSEKRNVKVSKVLYITANPKKTQDSFSLTVGESFLENYKKNNPQDEITTLDLYKIDVPLIDGVVLNAWGKFGKGLGFDALTPEEQKKIAAMNSLLDQFMAADKYIFVTPMWNFTVPPMMKAYLDNMCIANKTFKYTENGSVGLLNNKKAIHIQARGGIYSNDAAGDFEMGDKYINTILSFIGITDKQSIIIEGMNLMPDKAEEIKNNAIIKAKEAALTF